MKTNIKDIYKYMLDNCKYYTVRTRQQTYNNVIMLNYACCNGSSSIVYLMNLNDLEMLIIHTTEENKDIQEVQEQEGFIYQ